MTILLAITKSRDAINRMVSMYAIRVGMAAMVNEDVVLGIPANLNCNV